MALGQISRLEVMISSEMRGSTWERIRGIARAAISRGGFLPLDYEGLAPGPVEGDLAAGELGVALARRADMVVVIVGATMTDAVHEEIQTALDRRPTPPIGVFFHKSDARDESAELAREQLRDVTVFGDFSSETGLAKHVSAFLAQKSHLARRNRATPTTLLEQQVTVIPNQEERRKFMLLPGDRLTVLAESIKPSPNLPRQKFHFAVLSEAEFVQRTATTPYTQFEVGADRFTFRTSTVAQEAGYCYVVVRRPWWFQVGRATVQLTVTLTHPP
ncbi:MAG: hypothetical protein L3J96_00690 [Thermoplasmata archaeon]|nr:hypothetical protein [Thermoplasmata archaeon]